jgi:type II pantothenate kinase
LDIGQSLFKTASYENDELVLLIVNTDFGMQEIDNYVNSLKKRISQLNFTGGKAFYLYKQYKNTFETVLINEFEANINGLNLLYSLQKKKVLPASIVVTIGTGTSMILKKEKIEHIGGSALGGGFFMAITKLLYNIINYQEAIKLANKGNRYNIDLKVADIYDKLDPRVDLLFREFTAASLGKINTNIKLNNINKEDVLSAINAVLAENIGTMATIFADNNDISTIVFCGGFLINNKAFKQILTLLCKIKNKKAIFLNYSEYAGAIGALTYG